MLCLLGICYFISGKIQGFYICKKFPLYLLPHSLVKQGQSSKNRGMKCVSYVLTVDLDN